MQQPSNDLHTIPATQRALASPKLPEWARTPLERFVSEEISGRETRIIVSDVQFLVSLLSETQEGADGMRLHNAELDGTPDWMKSAILEFNGLKDYWDRRRFAGEVDQLLAIIDYRFW